MNRVETAYSQHLEAERHAGRVHWWGFEIIKFRLGEKCFFEPDFLVMLADDRLEIHEVKGSKHRKEQGDSIPWIEEDALVKLKVAADRLPFPFRIFFQNKQKVWVSRDL